MQRVLYTYCHQHLVVRSRWWSAGHHPCPWWSLRWICDAPSSRRLAQGIDAPTSRWQAPTPPTTLQSPCAVHNALQLSLVRADHALNAVEPPVVRDVSLESSSSPSDNTVESRVEPIVFTPATALVSSLCDTSLGNSFLWRPIAL
jgi:hypothetical protein